MIKKMGSNINHRSTVNAERDNIIRWFAEGAANDEVARRLQISAASLHRHTKHWGIKKIPQYRGYKKAKKFEPCSNKIKHLAMNAKWTKATI
tara:strand:+ start:336 stop:611 length:276 start_codon:yes stop_codon:yes gene_type:complete